ncbi:MAG: hypothetical protein WCQ82_07045 [Bacteroidaceae bacterium]|nr:hypothetical protein [Bacteroidaceae bacterium]
MKKLVLLALLCLMSLPSFSQARFFTWTHYPKDGDLKSYFEELHDVGIDGILVNSSAEKIKEMLPMAKKYGIEVHAWIMVMSNAEIAKAHPEWLDYNRLGQSLAKKKAYVDYYKFLNPIIPGVQTAILEQLKAFTVLKGLKSISLDYCRYVDAILPTSLWPKYGIKQDKVYPEWDYGYHPAMLEAFEKEYGYDPRNQEDVNGDEKWHQFRMTALNKFVKRIQQMAHADGKLVTASPFPTPEMSRQMVYQDWGAWQLDKAFPMIYNGFYYGDIEWITNCVKACVHQTTPPTEIYVGLFTDDFKQEKGSLSKAIKSSIQAGAKGFSLFMFASMDAAQKQELKTLIQELKRKTR